MEVNEGDPAPGFCLPGDGGERHCLEDFRGSWIILYFYPRDNTSGCTKEAIDFTQHLDEFEELGAVVVGISPDTPESHRKFREKHDLRVLLLSDTEKDVLKAYGVWKLKRLYGREYYGVLRSTFLIDPQGIIRKVWRGVRVKNHAAEVLSTLQNLKGNK